MPVNKNALIRYNALDKCFSSQKRRYYIKDLIKACSDAIFENTGIIDSVKRRQVYYDIQFMESEQGWSIPLEKIRDGHEVYYTYSDKGFSISKQPVNEAEVHQLQETLSILSRFKGMPQFEWMEEMLIRVESNFNIKNNNSKSIVGFDQNQYLKGLNYFTDLFNAIQYKKVLLIKYQGFKQAKASKLTIHPYYLKQYNNRWFLFGLNEELKSISNLALDRIKTIKPLASEFIENNEIDFDEYFEDVLGVSVSENNEVEKVLLEVKTELWPYIESKPIHGSQKTKRKTADFVLIELSLQINYELISIIFSYGEKMKVTSPLSLKQIIQEKAQKLLNNYL